MEENGLINSEKIGNINNLNNSFEGDILLEYSNKESLRSPKENKSDKKEIIQSSLFKNPPTLTLEYNKLNQILSENQKLLEDKESKIRQLKIIIQTTNSNINKLKTELKNNKSEITNTPDTIDKDIINNNIKNNDINKKICALEDEFELLSTGNTQVNEKNEKLSEVSKNYQIELKNSEKSLKTILENRKLKEIENEKLNELNVESLKLISLLKEKLSSYDQELANKIELEFLISDMNFNINNKIELKTTNGDLKENLLNQKKKLESKLLQLENYKKSVINMDNKIKIYENELIENKIQNNINEIKVNDIGNSLNNIQVDLNKNFYEIINWVETFFGNTCIIDNDNDQKDIPKIKEIDFINIKDLVQNLNNKKIKIKTNLNAFNEEYNKMYETKINLINKIANLDSNKKETLNEKNIYEKEIKDLNNEIYNINKNINLVNNNINDINAEKEYLRNEILTNRFIPNNDQEKIENEIKDLNKQNNNLFNINYSLKQKISEIIKNNIVLNQKLSDGSLDLKLNELQNELKTQKQNIINNTKNYDNKSTKLKKENNNLSLENNILQMKIKNMKTELQLKTLNCSKDEKILINKLKLDNHNLFNDNILIVSENKLLKEQLSDLKNKYK